MSKNMFRRIARLALGLTCALVMSSALPGCIAVHGHCHGCQKPCCKKKCPEGCQKPCCKKSGETKAEEK